MVEGSNGTKRFGFGVMVAATMTLDAGDAAMARDALGGLLDGATAKVTTKAGAVVELIELRVSRDMTLVSIDGVDPVQALARALRDFHGLDGDGSA